MLENYINNKFVIKEQTYDANSHLDSNSWYASGMDKIERISNTVIKLDGMKKQQYPMTSRLFSNKDTKVIKSYRYKYPVMVTPDDTFVVAQTPAVTTDVGLAYGEFRLPFRDNRIKRGWILRTRSGKQVRVKTDAEQQGDYYWVTLQHNGKSAIPVEDITAGVSMGKLFVSVSVERNRSSEITIDYPGEVQNQIGVFALGMSWGDIDNLNRYMSYEFTSNEGDSKKQLWMSYFMYRFNQEWASMLEDAIWYSKWNRDIDANRIALEEFGTGEAIPTFAGLLEQIPNVGTYSTLSYNKLDSMLMNLSYANNMDADGNYTFEVMTGRGGMREAHNALSEKGLQLVGNFEGVSEKFIKGEGNKIGLDGFFSFFTTIDGIKVKFTYNPRFDFSSAARSSPKHPKYPQLPLESFRMVFLDGTSNNGEANVQAVTTTPTGNATNYWHWTVLGGVDAPKDLMQSGSVTDSKPPTRAGELNVGSYHRRAKLGVQIKNASTCFDYQCVAK